MTTRMRADRLLVERGLFESRAKAQAAIAAGRVTADGAPIAKPSAEIAVDAALARRAGASLGVARRREARGRARSFRLRSGRPRLPRRRRLDRRLHRGAARARRAPRLRGRCRPRPAACAPARRGRRSSRSKATDIRKLDPARLPRAAGFRHCRCELHLAQARAAGGARAGRAARASWSR